MIRAIGVVLALLVSCSPPDTHAGDLTQWLGITGDDDRDAPRFNSGWPWVAVGRLDREDGAHCSATLVRRDVVLTAAHCVIDDRGSVVRPESARFSAGFTNGEARATAYGRRITVAEDLELDADEKPKRLQQDWAFIELDHQLYDGGWLRPVPMAPAAMAIKAGADRWRLSQAGYSGDQLDRLTRNRSCNVVGLSAGGHLLLHDCDATFGDSGSPILINADGEFSIVAVHSAIARHDGRVVGVAVVPPDDVHP
ncbi:MAG: trypsin-like peptidase domain-containing protein [Geminicoccaceae bacterium]